MILTKYIPTDRIRSMKIYINRDRLPLSAVVEREGPDLAITGNFYGPDWKPVCPLKADDQVMEYDPDYAYPALCWDQGPDVTVDVVPRGGLSPCRSYIANCAGIYHGQDQPMIFGADVGGRRGRTGWGFRDGALALVAFPDGIDGMTPLELRAWAKAQGWTDFILGDGGRKVNYYDREEGPLLEGRDPSQNLILIYLKKEEGDPMSDKKIVCLDPGHGPDTVNGSPDGSYKEKEFTWDLYERLRALLEGQGVEVVCTRAEDTKPSLTARAEVSNAAGADCFVSLHTNAAGDGGWYDARGLEIYTSSGPMTAPRNVLATDLVNAFHAAGVILRPTPIVHRMDLTVLTKTDAPAVLIEYGFHTSREDVALLKDSAYRDTMALATAKGVCAWLGVDWKGDAETVRPEDLPDPWAADAWTMAHYKGILDGTRPRDPVTRQELAVVLERLGLLD